MNSDVSMNYINNIIRHCRIICKRYQEVFSVFLGCKTDELARRLIVQVWIDQIYYAAGHGKVKFEDGGMIE